MIFDHYFYRLLHVTALKKIAGNYAFVPAIQDRHLENAFLLAGKR
jgi:hypothetical protein